MGAYDDIIHLPHPTSPRHPRMRMIDRAAQFSPFQALSGFGSAIRETARVTGERIELTEDEKAVLDEKLRYLCETGGEAIFTYFLPDGKKTAGPMWMPWVRSKKSTHWRVGLSSQTAPPSPLRTF